MANIDFQKIVETALFGGGNLFEKMADEKAREESMKEAAEAEAEPDAGTGDVEVTAEAGTFEGSVDTAAMAGQIGVDQSYITKVMNMSNLEKEKNPFMKSDLSKEPTFYKNDKGDWIDQLKEGATAEIADGQLTGNEDGTVHVESEYLGTFDYDPELYRYGYKEVKEKDGSVGQLPVLEYIGDKDGEYGEGWYGTRISDLSIPDGIKSCDYMFAENQTVRQMPRMPDSVETAHCMYAGAVNLDGASRAAKVGENMINTGGYVFLSHKLKDMSGMFKGCENLKEDFGKLPGSVVNIQGSFYGCENLGMKDGWQNVFHEYSLPEYGEDVTPYLSEEFAKDAFNDISSNKAKDMAKAVEYMVNEDGTLNGELSDELLDGIENQIINEGRLAESQAASAKEYQEDIYNGEVRTEVELESGGQLSSNKVYNAATGEYEYDETGELRSDDKFASEHSWQRYAIDGLAGLGIGGLAGKITGSKIVGLAAGAGSALLLDASGVLPKSFSPIISWTAGLLPEGSSVREKLEGWADKLSLSTINDQKAELTEENVAGMHQSMRLEDSVKAAGSVMVQDVSKSMENNGKAAASSMALWSTACKGEDSASVVGEYVSQCTGAMEEQWSAKIAETGITQELKTEMNEYYTKLFEALGSYNEGAREGIAEAFKDDPTKEKLSYLGLNMVNRAYMCNALESFNKLNKQYGFMCNDEIYELQDEQAICGVGNWPQCDWQYLEYDIEDDAAEAESLMALDGVENEMDSGEYDVDISDSVNAGAGAAAMVENAAENGAAYLESGDPKEDVKNADGKDRGKQASEATGYDGTELESSGSVDFDYD